MPSTSNPFDLLDLPPQYALDPALLRARFLALSAVHHPDRFIDPFEQAQAAERISAINAAHRALSDPLRRAEALLALAGSAGQEPENQKALPPGFLMETMEIRETLEEAQASGDTAALQRLRAWVDETRSEALTAVEQIFTQAAALPLDPQEAQKVRIQLNVLRYLNRMLEELAAS